VDLHFHIGDDLEGPLRTFAKARGLTMSAAVRLIMHDRFNEELKENQNANASDR
jgi:hypothetical protein